MDGVSPHSARRVVSVSPEFRRSVVSEDEIIYDAKSPELSVSPTTGLES